MMVGPTDQSQKQIAEMEARLEALEYEREKVRAQLEQLHDRWAAAQSSAPLLDTFVEEPNVSSAAAKVTLFQSLFRGREDVFPTRFESRRNGKAGYAPLCANKFRLGVCELPRIRCGECPNQAFVPVADRPILDHLRGRHVMGVYPLLPDETCWFLAVDFDKTSWQDDVAAFADTCSVTWREGRDETGSPRIYARFSRSDCGTCAARSLCTSSKDGRRTIYFHPRERYEALNRARARMHDPTWKERYHVRAGIEGTLSQGIRACGMRRSRYIGRAKTGLQEVCIAAGMNLARVVNWLEGRPRAKTRVSRFAALAPQPA